MKYDALLVVSFGGPEGMDEVIPFLENVTRGRNVPRERLASVAHHYEMFGGVSPINEQNRNLLAALKEELRVNGPELPIYWGNRNWNPLLPDALRQMEADGIQNALAFVTSAYSSYSSCRQYQENITTAQAEVGPGDKGAARIEKLRAFYNHPLFIEANVDRIRIASGGATPAHLAFTAHSIPESMAAHCEYAAQLEETGRLIAEALGVTNWTVVYQSRSGSPSQPWLGPDICEHLRELNNAGVKDVVVAPIGFVSDHMEVVYDLDVEAQQLAGELGMKMVRAATAGTHPSFVTMIRELIMERVDNAPARFLGSRGAGHSICPEDSCLAG
jgi:protoporphyrin/coproporphyrin ferrochelatase